jgi:hypothetical protein
MKAEKVAERIRSLGVEVEVGCDEAGDSLFIGERGEPRVGALLVGDGLEATLTTGESADFGVDEEGLKQLLLAAKEGKLMRC